MNRSERAYILPDYEWFGQLETSLLVIDLDRDMTERVMRSDCVAHRHACHEIIWIREGDRQNTCSQERRFDFPPRPRSGCSHRFHSSFGCLGRIVRFRDELLSEPSSVLFSALVRNRVLRINGKRASIAAAYSDLLVEEHCSPGMVSRFAQNHLACRAGS